MSDDDESTGGIPSRVAFRKKAKMGATKFTKSTKAFKHLEKLFQNKQILPTEKPNEVRMKDPLFMDFTNQQFRSQFNKLKGAYGCGTKESKYSMHTLLPVSIIHSPYSLLPLCGLQTFAKFLMMRLTGC
jgi:hypothetical protein